MSALPTSVTTSATSLKAVLQDLRLPVIGAPMFLASSPKLVIAQCRAGIAGAFPALNARTPEQLDEWLAQITEALEPSRAENQARRPAPFIVNQILVSGNERLDRDVELCIKYRVPLIVTSVGAPGDIVAAIHSYGGKVLHDVISTRHAEKAAAAGVDGIVAVCAGAGGHGGTLNPFGFIKDIRGIFSGVIALSGSITSGRDVLAARLIGADVAYIGTRFLATEECEVAADYKTMLLEGRADDIINTSLFSGLRGNYLAASIARSGLNPRQLPEATVAGIGTGGHGDYKLWKHIWAAGHGVGAIRDVPSVETLVARMEHDFKQGIADFAATLAH